MTGILIKTNARHAKELSAMLSPTRSFEPTGVRGQYLMKFNTVEEAIRGVDFLVSSRLVSDPQIVGE